MAAGSTAEVAHVPPAAVVVVVVVRATLQPLEGGCCGPPVACCTNTSPLPALPFVLQLLLL
jgi:hypothetical protein